MADYSLDGELIAPAAMSWLAAQRPASLLHIFENVCNLVDDQGQVLALTTNAVGPGPFSLMVAVDRKVAWPGFNTLLLPDSPVGYNHGRLTVGPIAVDLTTARRWSARPDWRRLPPSLLQAQWSDLTKWLLANAPEGSLALLLASPAAGEAGGQPGADWLAAAGAAWRQMAIALGRVEQQQAIQAAQQLAGLGGGLTPAGDDLLVGLIYALWVAWPGEQANPWAIRLAGAAMPLTGHLSAAWLAAAARGETVPAWHEFVASLVAADDIRWAVAISRIADTGHTSGADALAGFLLASRTLFV
jgi:hypothetical protein